MAASRFTRTRLLACALAITTAAAACSSDKGTAAPTESCNQLCVTAKFSSGAKTDFGSGVVECVCAGSGVGIQKTACETYCTEFNVAPEKAFLSMKNQNADKCVCDGTTAPH